LSNRCGQPGLSDHLAYYLNLEYRLRRRPHLVLVGPGVNRSNIDSALGALLVYEYCLLGIGTKFMITGDLTGRRPVIAPPGLRSRVAQLGAEALMKKGALAVVQRFRPESGADSAWECEWLQTSSRSPWRFASRRQEVSSYLPLESTMDATLAHLGRKSRKNLRYYRRRAEAELGCTFVDHVSITFPEFEEFNRRTAYAAKGRMLKLRAKLLEAGPNTFAYGLQGEGGQWLSMVAGIRTSDGAEADWFMNRSDLSEYSLGTVMRSYFIDHEISRGTARIYIEGGTAHFTKDHFTTEPVLDLFVVKRSWIVPFFRRLAVSLISDSHPERQILEDKSIHWGPWPAFPLRSSVQDLKRERSGAAPEGTSASEAESA